MVTKNTYVIGVKDVTKVINDLKKRLFYISLPVKDQIKVNETLEKDLGKVNLYNN
jgi:hypothetical protein